MTLSQAMGIVSGLGYFGALASTPVSDALTVTLTPADGKRIVVGHVRHGNTVGTGTPNVSITTGAVEIFLETAVLGTDASLANTLPIAGLNNEVVVVEFASTTVTAGYLHVSFLEV